MPVNRPPPHPVRPDPASAGPTVPVPARIAEIRRLATRIALAHAHAHSHAHGAADMSRAFPDAFRTAFHGLAVCTAPAAAAKGAKRR
jgi:hypothetical protein